MAPSTKVLRHYRNPYKEWHFPVKSVQILGKKMNPAEWLGSLFSLQSPYPLLRGEANKSRL
jgi:hypothetical protein